VTQHINRAPDGIDYSSDVFELAFERIVRRITAFPAATAVQRIDRELLLKQWKNGIPPCGIVPGAVDEHKGLSFS
jgi:hypothetical protein